MSAAGSSRMDERLRIVEIDLSRVKQRVDDHEADFVRFAPMIVDVHELKWTLEKAQKDLGQAHEAIRELSERLDREHKERVEGQAERKRELEEAQAARDLELKKMEQVRVTQNREMRNRLLVATIALIGVFLTAAGGVLVQLVSGGG